MPERDFLNKDLDLIEDPIAEVGIVEEEIITPDSKNSELLSFSPTIQSLVDENLFSTLTNKEKDELRELNRLLAKNPKILERIMRWINLKRGIKK